MTQRVNESSRQRVGRAGIGEQPIDEAVLDLDRREPGGHRDHAAHAVYAHRAEREALEVHALERRVVLEEPEEVGPHGAEHGHRTVLRLDRCAEQRKEAVDAVVRIVVSEQLLELVDDDKHAGIASLREATQVERRVEERCRVRQRARMIGSPGGAESRRRSSRLHSR